MPEEIKCPNPKCQSTNFINLHAEQDISSPAQGKKPFEKLKKRGPKYECRVCGRKF